MSRAQLPAQPTAHIQSVVASAVQDVGLELEELVIAPAGRRRLVRVVVDTPDGAALDLDAVADVSRVVSDALDVHADLLSGAYTLEVSSPGLDRPLIRPRHWRRARLRLVKVRTADGVELVGRVGDADETSVTLLIGGELRRLAFTEIDRAVVQVEFAEPPAAEIAALASDLRLREESP